MDFTGMCADFLWKKAPQLPPHHHITPNPGNSHPKFSTSTSSTRPHLLTHTSSIPKSAHARQRQRMSCRRLQNATTRRGRLPGTYPSPFTFQSSLSQPPGINPTKSPFYKCLPTQCPFCFTPPGPRHFHLRRPNPHHEHSPYPSPHKSPRHAKHTMSCHTHTIPIPLPIYQSHECLMPTPSPSLLSSSSSSASRSQVQMSRIAVSPNPKIRTVTITTDDRPHYQSTVDDVDCDPTRTNPHTPFVVRHPTTSPQKARPPACKPLPPLGLGICECKMPRELHETATQHKNNNLLLCPGWPSVRLLRHVDVRPSGPFLFRFKS